MATYYGIEESTDSRCPQTRVTRLPSRSAAESFADTPTRSTYADPKAARNYHHTLYSAFEMPARWKPPSKAAMREAVAAHYRWGSRTYPLNEAMLLAQAIRKDGSAVP